MMRVEVSAFGAGAPERPLSAEFDEMGGSIGRADGNTLVLPDAHRYISRTQAAIRFHAGAYLLRDAGSATPTYVNDNAVGNGNEVALNDGDRVRIGEYTLSVSIVPSGAAHFAAPVTRPFSDPLQVREQSPSRARADAAPAAPFPGIDDPFGTPAPHAHPSAADQHIPTDFDPFSSRASSASKKPLIPDDLGLEPVPSAGVDDLFGLKQPGGWDPLGPQDPLGGLPHSPGPTSDDLLGLGGGMPAARERHAPVQQDHAPPLSGAFRPPQARPEPAPAAARPPSAETRPGESAPSNGPVLSWEGAAEASNDIRSVIVPAPKETEVRAQPPREQRVPQPAPPPKRAAPAPVSDTAPRAHAEADELLKAFLAGAGTPELRLPDGLTPELMNLLGRVLREAIGGTLQLLLARALTKREVRAEATLIVARENNPLKFSPTPEAALMHLLVPHGRGFMPPVTAVKDAYNDLRSHQFGIMAGMRGALTSVLGRFDPAQLEQRLTRKRGLGSSLLTSRKAKLWELYEQLHSEISREAEDDFQALFGREFLKAYEAQIRKLEQEDTDS
jgi:FHA domain-containing protein